MSQKISHAELIEVIADESQISKVSADRFLKELVSVAVEGLKEDGKIQIVGLGRFEVKGFPEREGRNPRTGDPIIIPPQNHVTYKPEAGLREFVNRKFSHLHPRVIEEPVQSKPKQPKPAPVPVQAPPPPPEPEPPLLPEEAVDPPETTFVSQPPPEKPSPPVTQKERSKWERFRIFHWLFLLIVLLVILWMVFKIIFQPQDFSYLQLISQQAETEESSTDMPELAAEPVAETEDMELPHDTIKDTTAIPLPLDESLLDEVEDEDIQFEPEAIEVESPEQSEEGIVETPIQTHLTPGGVHEILRKDNLWLISEFFYGSPYLWPNIYRVNLKMISNPDLIVTGDVIQVPPLEGEVGNLTQKDVYDISEGYLLVYRYYTDSGEADAQYYLWVADQYLTLDSDSPYWELIDEDDLRAVSRWKGSVLFK